MNKPEFTNGEWKLVGEVIGIVDDRDSQSYGMCKAVAHIDKYDFPDEWQANANLIKASPKMYQMLDDLCNYLFELDALGTTFKARQMEKLLKEIEGGN